MIKYTLRACFIALVTTTCAFAQSKDSVLYERYKEIRKRNVDSAQQIVHEGLRHSKAGTLLRVKLTAALGWTHLQKKNSQLSIKYYKQALDQANAIKNDDWIANTSNIVGTLYQEGSQYDSAIFYFLLSVKASRRIGSRLDLGIGLCNIGLIYYKINSVEEAIEYLTQSIYELENTEGGSEFLIPAYINAGLAYSSKSEYPTALGYFQRARDICTSNPTYCSQKMNLDIRYNLGILLYRMGKESNALEELTQSYSESVASKDYVPSSTSSYFIANIKADRQQYAEALTWLNKSETFALLAKSLERRKNNAALRAEIFEKMGNIDSSLFYLKRYDLLKDSLFNSDLINGLKQVNIAEQKELSDRVILSKDEEIYNRKRTSYLLAVVILQLCVLAYFFYRQYRNKKKTASRLEEEVQSRTKELTTSNTKLIESRKDLDTFIYRLSHNVRAPLSTLLGLTHLAKQQVQDIETQDLIKKIDSTVSNLNDILTQLIVINQVLNLPLNYTHFNLSEVIIKSRDKNKHLNHFPLVDWSLKINSPTPMIFCDKSLLQLVIDGLIKNAYYYISSDSKNQHKVSVTVNELESTIQILVEDNGRGIIEGAQDKIFDIFFVADQQHGLGLGLFQAKLACEKINSAIKISRLSAPTTFELLIPKLATY